VQDGKTLATEVEYVEGLRWDRGFTSPYFVTNAKAGKVEYDNPMILLVEKKITSLQEILKFLEHANQTQKPLLIVAEDMESEPLAALVVNKLRGGLKVVFVKAPGFGDNRRNTMQDIAISTGATLISSETGLSIETAGLESLGYAKNVIIDKDNTIIMGGTGAEEDIKERISQIESAIEVTTSEYDKEKL
jgi:chaperonin GroEL